MATDIQVKFMHPVDGRILTVTLADTWTAQEVVDQLIDNSFIKKPDPRGPGYNLAIRGGAILLQNQTLAAGGVTNGTVLRIIPATTAGARRF